MMDAADDCTKELRIDESSVDVAWDSASSEEAEDEWRGVTEAVGMTKEGAASGEVGGLDSWALGAGERNPSSGNLADRRPGRVVRLAREGEGGGSSEPARAFPAMPQFVVADRASSPSTLSLRRRTTRSAWTPCRLSS